MLTKILVMLLMWVVIGPIAIYGISAWCVSNANHKFRILKSDERYDRYFELMIGMNGGTAEEFAKSIISSSDRRKNLLIKMITIWPTIVADIQSRHDYAMSEMEKEYGTPTKEES